MVAYMPVVGCGANGLHVQSIQDLLTNLKTFVTSVPRVSFYVFFIFYQYIGLYPLDYYATSQCVTMATMIERPCPQLTWLTQ